MYTDLLVYIIRHGETNENRLGIIQGQMDTQLNDAGRDQAKLTRRALKNVNFVKAYTSDSSRAADTARAIVVHHPKCELVPDARLRERNMGTLSGTKAPARRPLPPSVEPGQSIQLRLNNFWDNAILPLLLPSAITNDSPEGAPLTADPASGPSSHLGDQASSTPSILLVSHGATISKLIHDVLLYENGYTPVCDISRRGIYNASISVVRLHASRMNLSVTPPPDDARDDGADQASVSVSGELVTFASIAHLTRRQEMVTENADMLEQRNS